MRTVLLFSGGWDSAAAYYETQIMDPELMFISYGQKYMMNELNAAKLFGEENGEEILLAELDLSHDQERRNFFFITEMKRLGYDRVIVGSRNIHPLFDKYKDSNWWSLRKFGKLMNIEIVQPIVGWNKRKIVKHVQRFYPHRLYNCYANNTDLWVCGCPNCKEMRTIL